METDVGVNLSMETDAGVNVSMETDVGVNLSMEIDIGVNLSMETDAGVNLYMEEVVARGWGEIPDIPAELLCVHRSILWRFHVLEGGHQSIQGDYQYSEEEQVSTLCVHFL